MGDDDRLRFMLFMAGAGSTVLRAIARNCAPIDPEIMLRHMANCVRTGTDQEMVRAIFVEFADQLKRPLQGSAHAAAPGQQRNLASSAPR